ncbi:Ankyrin repeat protein 1 [Giardia muris]|uniref:Ankyrin repeat protein 1 n=1 Tax=Giardia muris TaxID=5742 RepID=A0A4Z1SPR3_GIAMU|nr:Ankyrin repeat protein 1 [Giardia muris]|eukprot:TNJ27796.1 Ankyrin repeat protein 1 [Giardia muris]
MSDSPSKAPTYEQLALLDILRGDTICQNLYIRRVIQDSNALPVLLSDYDDHCTMSYILAHTPDRLTEPLLFEIAHAALLALAELQSHGLHLIDLSNNNIVLSDTGVLLANWEGLLAVGDYGCNAARALGQVLRDASALLPTAAQDYRFEKLVDSLVEFSDSSSFATLIDFIEADVSSKKETFEPSKADFLRAAEHGDANTLRVMLTRISPGTVDASGNTALMLAAQRFHLDAVRILAPLEMGLVNKLTGNTALHFAAQGFLCQHETAVAEFVLSQFVRLLGERELSVSNRAGETPLSLAITLGLPTTLIELMLEVAPKELFMPKYDTLPEAVQAGDLVSVYQLLSTAGIRDLDGQTALMYAIATKNIACVRLLQCEKNLCTEAGVTPWQLAYDCGLLDCLPYLALTPELDLHGNTQLHRAVLSQDLEQCRASLSLARLKNNDGYTALMLAAAAELEDIVCLLRVYEAGEHGPDGFTALQQCCVRHHDGPALLLSSFEVDVFSTDGRSAAEIAFSAGNLELARQLLLPTHKRPTCIDSSGRTALIRASQANDAFGVFCTLDQAGAVDEESFTALMHACVHDYRNVIALLLPLEATIETVVNGQVTDALDIAVAHAHYETAALIVPYLSESIDLEEDLTPLMCAARAGRIGRVWRQKDYLSIQDSRGWTALMHAISQRHSKCVDLLLPERTLVAHDGTTAWILAYQTGQTELLGAVAPSPCIDDATGDTTLHSLIYKEAARYADLLAIHTPEDALTAFVDTLELHQYLPCLYQTGIQNSQGLTSLMLAAQLGVPYVPDLLLQLEAEFITGENCATTFAVSAGNISLLKQVWVRETDALETLGHSILIIAAIINDVPLALEHIDEAGRRAGNGNTALMYASLYGHETIGRLLLHAETGLRSTDGYLATDFAMKGDQMGLFRILLRHEFQHYPNGLAAMAILAAHDSEEQDTILPLICALLAGSEEDQRTIVFRDGLESCVEEATLRCSGAEATLQQSLVEPILLDDQRNTPLHIAASRDDLEETRHYLHLVRERNMDGRTALMLAVLGQSRTVLPILMESEAGMEDNEGNTATDLALLNEDYSIAKLLLRQELPYLSKKGFTPLMAAVLENDIEAVRTNIRHCEAVYRGRETALTLALKMRALHLVDTLRVEARIPVQDRLPWSLARDFDMPQILPLLRPPIEKIDGYTELQLAVRNNDFSTAEERLYQAGEHDRSGRTALLTAVELGVADFVRLLAPHEAQFRLTGQWSHGSWLFDSPSPLLVAAALGRLDICTILLPQTPIEAYTDRNGFTPLMIAADAGNKELLALFVDSSMLGCADRTGTTALMWAAKHGHGSCVRLLLREAGRINSDQDCALKFAMDARCTEAVALLAQREKSLVPMETITEVVDQDIASLLASTPGSVTGTLRESVGIKRSRVRSAGAHFGTMFTSARVVSSNKLLSSSGENTLAATAIRRTRASSSGLNPFRTPTASSYALRSPAQSSVIETLRISQ